MSSIQEKTVTPCHDMMPCRDSNRLKEYSSNGAIICQESNIKNLSKSLNGGGHHCNKKTDQTRVEKEQKVLGKQKEMKEEYDSYKQVIDGTDIQKNYGSNQAKEHVKKSIICQESNMKGELSKYLIKDGDKCKEKTDQTKEEKDVILKKQQMIEDYGSDEQVIEGTNVEKNYRGNLATEDFETSKETNDGTEITKVNDDQLHDRGNSKLGGEKEKFTQEVPEKETVRACGNNDERLLLLQDNREQMTAGDKKNGPTYAIPIGNCNFEKILPAEEKWQEDVKEICCNEEKKCLDSMSQSDSHQVLQNGEIVELWLDDNMIKHVQTDKVLEEAHMEEILEDEEDRDQDELVEAVQKEQENRWQDMEQTGATEMLDDNLETSLKHQHYQDSFCEKADIECSEKQTMTVERSVQKATEEKMETVEEMIHEESYQELPLSIMVQDREGTWVEEFCDFQDLNNTISWTYRYIYLLDGIHEFPHEKVKSSMDDQQQTGTFTGQGSDNSSTSSLPSKNRVTGGSLGYSFGTSGAGGDDGRPPRRGNQGSLPNQCQLVPIVKQNIKKKTEQFGAFYNPAIKECELPLTNSAPPQLQSIHRTQCDFIAFQSHCEETIKNPEQRHAALFISSEFKDKLHPSDKGYREDKEYSVHKLLGTGTYGTVHEVADTKSKYTFTRKKVELEHLKLQELRSLHVLNSLYIPRMCGASLFFSEREGKLYVHIFQELIPGTYSLMDAVSDGMSFTKEDALHIMQCVLQALEEMHKNGIVHGDVHPGNVLLDDYSNAYLIDFGKSSRMEGTDFSMYGKDLHDICCVVKFCLEASHPNYWTYLQDQYPIGSHKPLALRNDLTEQEIDFAPIMAKGLQTRPSSATKLLAAVQSEITRCNLCLASCASTRKQPQPLTTDLPIDGPCSLQQPHVNGQGGVIADGAASPHVQFPEENVLESFTRPKPLRSANEPLQDVPVVVKEDINGAVAPDDKQQDEQSLRVSKSHEELFDDFMLSFMEFAGLPEYD